MQGNWAPKLVSLLAVAILASVSKAHAGMTVYGLRDIYRLRFEEISFFLFLLLLCALVLKLVWNYAFKGFVSVPKLKYLQALSVSLLFGLTMLLILTMISGIREVLTPGAWRHQGTSYRLNDPAQELDSLLQQALLDADGNVDGVRRELRNQESGYFRRRSGEAPLLERFHLLLILNGTNEIAGSIIFPRHSKQLSLSRGMYWFQNENDYFQMENLPGLIRKHQNQLLAL